MSAVLSDRTVDEMNELRMVSEVDAAGRATERATQADLRAKEDTLYRYREAFEFGEKVSECDVEFNRVVEQATKSAAATRARSWRQVSGLTAGAVRG